ncbi:MAG: hypothetical protein ACREDQ_01350 [Limisphaerales bacterium]
MLKIALDVHLAWHVIAAQEDDASLKPPRCAEGTAVPIQDG